MKIIKDLLQSVEVLQIPGTVAVLPTDTIYGLAARATDKVAVGRLYAFKNREHKPGTVIAADIDQLVALGIPRRYLVPVASYWPNPISIVIPSVPNLSYLDLGKFSLAVRIPADKAVHELLVKTGPLLTSSANYPGEAPAQTIAEAQKYFADQVDVYVDGGVMTEPASTIIRVIDDAVEVLREGSIKISESGEIIQ